MTADIAAFYRVWLGRMELGQALRGGLVDLEGSPRVRRAFPSWFAWSPMAGPVRAALSGLSETARLTHAPSAGPARR